MWTKDIAQDIKDRRISGIIMQHEAEPLHNLPEDIARAKEMLVSGPGIRVGHGRSGDPHRLLARPGAPGLAVLPSGGHARDHRGCGGDLPHLPTSVR